MTAAKGLAFRLQPLEILNENLRDLLRGQSEKEYARMLTSADPRTQIQASRILSAIGDPKAVADLKRHSFAPSKEARDLARKVLTSTLDYSLIANLILDMSLVYLVSQFETFLQQMITLVLERMPGPILAKTLTLKELTEWKNVREAKRRIIEKEIHDIKLTNPDEADEYFLRKFNVRLSALPRWREFRERFYRRNIIVHRLGQPDQRYRDKTGRRRLKEPGVSKNYLATSIVLFSVTARRVAHELERRFRK
jgi:hypothetical protein